MASGQGTKPGGAATRLQGSLYHRAMIPVRLYRFGGRMIRKAAKKTGEYPVVRSI